MGTNQRDVATERREHERQPLRVDARISAGGPGARRGIILDFGFGGIFMRVDELEDDYLVISGRQVGNGDEVFVHFSGGDEDARDLTASARIVRMMAGGIGLAFEGADPAAVRALERMARAARRSREGARGAPGGVGAVDAATATALLDALKQRVAGFLHARVEELFSWTKDSLFEAARDARSNAEQEACFDAIREADRARPSVLEEFSRILAEKLDRIAQPGGLAAQQQSLDDSMAMSLIDTSAFNDWLTVKNMITRWAPGLREPQFDLEQRLAHLFHTSVDEENDPVGLMEICISFQDSMQHLGLGNVARQEIYQAFERQVVGQLRGLYEELNALLAERGILPTVERPKAVTRRPSAAARRADPVDTSELPTVPDSEEVPTVPLGEPVAPGAQAAYTSPGAAHPQAGPPAAAPHPSAPHPVAPHPGTPYAGASYPGTPHPGTPHPGAPPSPQAPGTPAGTGGWAVPAEAAAAAYAYAPAARAVPAGPQVGMGAAFHAAGALMGYSAPAAGVPVSAAPSAKGPSRQLAGALGRLRGSRDYVGLTERAGPLAFGTQVQRAMRADGGQLEGAEAEAVGIISSLIDAIVDDPMIGDSVKTRIKRLALPLLDVAMRDAGFLAEEMHPARQTINRLSRLELPLDATGGVPSLRASVDPVIDRLVERERPDRQAFEEALPVLDELLAAQGGRFAENVARAIQASSAAPSGAIERPASMTPEQREWYARVPRLRRGDMLSLDVPGGGAERMTLAWAADDHRTVLLADGAGDNTVTLTRAELASRLAGGSARLIEAPEVPAVDRGVYSMLQALLTKVSEEASHDPVTGLMRRLDFEERLARAHTHALSQGSGHVVWVLDAEGFDQIVEASGETAANALLAKLGKLLERLMGGRGLVTRLEGARFAALLEFSPLKEGRDIAERQRRAVNQARVAFHGQAYPLRASIGLVFMTDSYASVTDVLDAAMAALEQARVHESDEVEVSRPVPGSAPLEPPPPAATLSQLLAGGGLALRRQRVAPAGEEGADKPLYQVVLGVVDAGQPADVPDAVQLASEGDPQRAAVDRWMIDATLTWLGENRRDMLRAGGFIVPLSDAAFADEGLLDHVVAKLTERNVPPGKVLFEVSEAAARDPLSSAVAFMRGLGGFGCRFCMGGFGTAEASFAQLGDLPLGFLKIDARLVRRMGESAADQAVVQSVSEVAQLLGKQTIAEGVDEEPLVALLAERGVGLVCGLAVEAPVPLA